MPGPLAGVRILDFTVGIAGPYATKLLADYGADVIKIEPPGGDFTRQLGPFRGDIPDSDGSGTFLYFNTNKRSVELDLTRHAGVEAALRLAATADIAVESFRPGALDALGVGFAALNARKPSLSLVSVTNFGQDGPYRDYKGTELTLYGFAGEMYTMGVLEREPVKMYGTAALVESGSAAAVAAMGALFVSQRQGIGQHVDVAIADSHFGGADRRHVGAIAFEFSGRKTPRASVDARAALRGVYPCADGYVELSGAGARLDRFAKMLGDPEWLRDPKWFVPGALLKPENAEELEANLYPWLYSHTKREIWAAAQEARVLCGPLFTIDEIAADAHFRARGFWARVDHPAAGEFEMPGRPFIMPRSPWELRRNAPCLGEHTREVLLEAGLTPSEIRAATGAAPVGSR
jgi:crotonobetainyl-CoA:carnitine CoA-transferase CaiB-like acyl-CoA transferase